MKPETDKTAHCGVRLTPLPHGALLGNGGIAAEDPIFALLQAYRQDQRNHKVDLGIGVYRDALNQSPVFAAVKQAEQWRVDTEADKAYIGPLGDQLFCRAITELVLGGQLAGELAPRLACAQTPGGVGALRLAFELLAKSSDRPRIWFSDTTWQVHRPIAEAAGFKPLTYAYYDGQQAAGFAAMLESLSDARPGDAILLQASCHNPTGLDLADEEWHELALFCLCRGVLPVIDMAYHGLGKGLEEDAEGLRIMARAMPELLLCYTCSKNFGLYRDRTGMVMALTGDSGHQQIVMQQWADLATRHYFTPPAHGAMLVRRILQNTELQASWREELSDISQRLEQVRRTLHKGLSQAVPQRDWQFLSEGRGMFALLPLSTAEISQLQQRHAVYIVANGRVNLSGFNPQNCQYIIDCIAQATTATDGPAGNHQSRFSVADNHPEGKSLC